MKRSKILASPLEVWNDLKQSGGLILHSYDKELHQELFETLSHRSTDKRYAGDNRLIVSKSSHRRHCLAPRCRLISSWG